METVGMVVGIIGVIVLLVGNIMLLIKSFQTSVLWGLGYLLVPFVALVFVCMHWEQSKKGFGLVVLGGLLFIGSALFAPGAEGTPLPE